MLRFTTFFGAGFAAAAGCALRYSTAATFAATALCDPKSQNHSPEEDAVVNDAFIAANADDHPRHASSTTKVQYPWHSQSTGLTLRYKPFECIANVELAPDVKLLRFALPDGATYHVPPCSTLQFRLALSTSDSIERWYTPCTQEGAPHFDIIVRRMPGGRMSTALMDFPVGKTIDVRMQQFKMRYKPNKWDEVGMIAGGTGITPMLQVIRQGLPLAKSDTFSKHVSGGDFSKLGNTDDTLAPDAAEMLSAQQAEDKVRMSLLFCNRSEEHVMLKSYLDELAVRFPDRFRVAYVIDKAKNPATWKGYQGYVNGEMLGKMMPRPKTRAEVDPARGNQKKNIVLVSGPDGLVTHVCGMRNAATLEAMHGGRRGGSKKTTGLGDIANLAEVEGLLGNLGFDKDNVYRF